MEQAASFSMAESELDTSFFNNFQAMMYQRIMDYKRNKKLFFTSVIVPALLLILGMGLAKIDRAETSPSRLQTPDRLTLPQRLLFNSEAVVPGSDVSMTALAEGLGTQYFDITYTDRPNNFSEYYEEVFDHRSGKIPFMYGSYEIHSASKADQYYEFVSLVNLTSIDSAGLYPNFMYESILKTATSNPDFNFKVRSTPYPPTRFILDRVVVSATNSVLIQIAISYGIILSAIATYIVLERTNGLKHLQSISGMRRSSYWLANFFMDFFKLMITILLTIILFFAF